MSCNTYIISYKLRIHQIAEIIFCGDRCYTAFPFYSGNITKVERKSGITSITAEDNFRNLMNSQFVADYIGIATHITTDNGLTTLYGTVKDVIGSLVMVDDKGDIQLIKR